MSRFIRKAVVAGIFVALLLAASALGAPDSSEGSDGGGGAAAVDHAIIVPYRHRELHLREFREHMGPYLKMHFPKETFAIWVVEQDDEELFRKASLVNAGYTEILKKFPDVKCITMHDVDMIPISFVPYNKCEYPQIQIRDAPNKKDWIKPYPFYFGGCVTLSPKHWEQINGMGNDYVGWGCEDDDVYYRLRANNLLVNVDNATMQPRRPPEGQGIFYAIDESNEHHPMKYDSAAHNKNCRYLIGQMKRMSDRWKYDGLSNLCYEVTEQTVTQELTTPFYHIKVSLCTNDGKSCKDEKEEPEVSTRALEAYLEEHPTDSHALISLAEAYKESGQHAKAVEYFRKRLEFKGGYDELELWTAQLSIGHLAVEMGEPEEIIVKELLAAYVLRPFMPNPLYTLAFYFRNKGELLKAYVFASPAVQVISDYIKNPPVVVNLDSFYWNVLDELCTAAYYVGRMDEGMGACQSILDLVDKKRIELDQGNIDRIKANIQLYKERYA